MVRKARLVLNPIPWSRKAWRRLPEIIGILEESGIRADLTFTKLTGYVAELVARAVEDGYDLVIVGGGDGTVGEVATGLVGTGITLGILPFGTFNNVAHSLGVSLDLDEAARSIARGKTLDIDVGVANGTYFFEAAGVGLDASLFPIGEEIKGGHYRKLLGGANRFLRQAKAEIKVAGEGFAVDLHTPLVVVANGPYYGAGFTVAPRANLTDGMLDVINFECTRVELARQFTLSSGNRLHEESCVATFRAGALTITSSLDLPAHADGRPIGTVPVTCSVLPGALRVIVP
ncbi:MAG: diacylglycerol kinase family lipid kinase [Dehalococcoidia bacterium]|nr:diacylglycerol kinase family lipid kinase [Dehalococcoidia bacterium]